MEVMINALEEPLVLTSLANGSSFFTLLPTPLFLPLRVSSLLIGKTLGVLWAASLTCFGFWLKGIK